MMIIQVFGVFFGSMDVVGRRREKMVCSTRGKDMDIDRWENTGFHQMRDFLRCQQGMVVPLFNRQSTRGFRLSLYVKQKYVRR